MIIGNSLILTPPGSKTSIIVPTIVSGNTCGAVFWTDTKCEAPMLPDRPSHYKHPIEGTLFWIDDCEKNGTLPPGRDTEPDFPRKGLNPAAKPTADDYFAALESGIADTDKRILEIRIRLWWLGNDPVREGRASEPEPRFLENLTQLVLLYSGKDKDSQLVKAELLRELGYFKDALALLENQDFGDLQYEAKFIASLCQTQDARVAKIP